ncbi:MAG: peptidylprolyl isomerase [Myxococcota bacterium]
MSDTLSHGKVGIFHYTLTDDTGEQIDSSRGGGPLAYLHGYSNIVPGLEKQLEGKTVGDAFVANVPAAEGYGERSGPGPQAVHRSQFPKDMPLEPGRPVNAQDGEGNTVTLWIADVKGAQVYLDVNHPLAGKTLNFDVEIVGVRDATEDEKTHGHAHGPDGHGHHH